MTFLRKACLVGVMAMMPLAASAQETNRIGTLSCDVSGGIGMFVSQKQTMSCVFKQDGRAHVEKYNGSIDQFGVELGEVSAGHLIWEVVAATKGHRAGALAGTYSGVGTNASIGLGAGANVLVGGTGRAFQLQPISVQGQTGVNFAGGITTFTLRRG
jgi:Protein of unknown function (DUF992)